MSASKKILIVFLVFLALLGLDVFFEVNFPKLNVVEVKSSKMQKGREVRIIQISDLHSQQFFNNQDLYKKIKNSQPDLIVITGDLIDKTTKNYNSVYGFVDELIKINKNVYFVAGDHEQKSGKNFLRGLVERGVKVLNRDCVVFEKDGQKIDIYGLNYYNTSDDINFAENISADNYSVLLIHNPDLVIENKNIKADLILSGDTHGGQIRLPFLGALNVPGQPIFPKYSKGLYILNNNSLLYIDSGLGNTFAPIRFFNRSQISLIKIVGQ